MGSWGRREGRAFKEDWRDHGVHVKEKYRGDLGGGLGHDRCEETGSRNGSA